jgi:hypothetical protein
MIGRVGAMLVAAFFLGLAAPTAAAGNVPEPPLALAAAALPDGTVMITWTPSSSADVTEYRVYRSGAADGLVGTTPDTSFVDQVPIPNVPITIVEYMVTAVNRDGESAPSAPAYVVLLDPESAPDCVYVDPGTVPPGWGVDPDCLPPLP